MGSVQDQIRNMYNNRQYKIFRDQITIEILPDYIFSSSSLFKNQYNYSFIEDIVTSRDAIYIFVSSNSAIIIPNRAFASEQQKQECFELLNLYHSAKYA